MPRDGYSRRLINGDRDKPTEIAKTLTEFLFASADRMIRLDMSEFQTADSISWMLGEGDKTAEGNAL